MSKRSRAVKDQERYRPSRFEFWKRLFIWIFIALFVFSVAGGVIALQVRR